VTFPIAAPETYLIEQYLPTVEAVKAGSWVAALCRAATEVSAEGTGVKLVCTILVRVDDLCLHMLAAPSPEAAARAAELAGITPERTIEAIAWWPADQTDQERNER
jgi:hypothetical protein